MVSNYSSSEVFRDVHILVFNNTQIYEALLQRLGLITTRSGEGMVPYASFFNWQSYFHQQSPACLPLFGRASGPGHVRFGPSVLSFFLHEVF